MPQGGSPGPSDTSITKQLSGLDMAPKETIGRMARRASKPLSNGRMEIPSASHSTRGATLESRAKDALK